MPDSLRLFWEGGAADWALAAGALALLVFSARASRGAPRLVAAARLTALALLLLLAAKPALLVTTVKEERPRVAMLLDVSRGMGRSEGGVSDLKRAVRALESMRPGLAARADLQLYTVGERALRREWDALDRVEAAGGLDLAQALDDVWRDQGSTLAAAWLVSNGAGDRSRDLNAAVSKLGCPIFTLSAARPKADAGLRVDRVRVPEFAFQHLPFPLNFSWTARGVRGAKVRVRVTHQGREIAASVFAVSKDFEVGSSSLAVVSPALGTQQLRVEFAPAPGSGERGGREDAVPFKRQVKDVVIETVREKLRILYLAGHPSFEYSQLRHFLKSNPNFELVSFVILRNPENVVPVPESELSLIPFPAQEIFVSTLEQFDLFILEDFSYARFQLPVAYLDFLRRFVERGGGLLVVGGETGFVRGGYRGTPLESMLPVELAAGDQDWQPGSFRVLAGNPGHPLLNLEGEPGASRQLWEKVPAMEGFNRFKRLKAGASVFLAHPEAKMQDGRPQPVLAGSEFGRGRVMVLASPTTWRWKLGAYRAQIGAFYESYWQRCIQYLTGSLELGKVRLAPLAEAPVEGEPFTLWTHVLDETFSPLSDAGLQLEVRIRPAAGSSAGRGERLLETREVRPGVYQADVAGLQAGAWEVLARAKHRGRPWGEDARPIAVREAAAEDVVNRILLDELARRSGGSYADLESIPFEEWLSALPRPEQSRGVSELKAVWASPSWLWVLLALFFVDWYARRRSGMR